MKSPSYDSLRYWASHPDKQDAADITERTTGFDIDVFFIHPTIYSKRPVKNFIADLDDEKLNSKIQTSTIKNQASVFSGNSNIYAPYYRQMHLQGYFTKNAKKKAAALNAFDTAYADVLKAFNYYLKNDNKGKPFVLAAHSQGTNHSERLLKEVILPNDTLKSQLVLAYLVGMPITENFDNFDHCVNPIQTGCYLTWRTYGKKYTPKVFGDSIVCSNPITFDTNLPESKLDNHQGILFKDGNLKSEKTLIAEVKDGYLTIEIMSKPEKWIYRWDNYHIADYNLFWQNIHDNFEVRIAKFLVKY
ncbi:MAG: DUF3089 domain-containing protein [Bacteroidia bacterium]|nr:DUF3089 domain-containing protein [Bacteroidia bacterium]